MSAANPMRPLPYQILQRTQETADTFSLELAPLNGEAIAPFAAGQFNMLYVYGAGEVPISVSGDPGRPTALTHTVRAVGRVTQGMSRLQPGARLGVRGPFGVGWPLLEAEGRDVVIVAGGIGLAPLRPTIYHVIQHRERFGRVIILYGARSPRDILYLSDLQAWRSHLDIELRVTVDNADDKWRGYVGFVTQLVGRAPFDPDDTLAMICGPEVMMHYTIQELNRRGVPDAAIYVSMERNMQCGLGLCGHCQFGPTFVCKDGPVFRFDQIRRLFTIREL